MQTSGSSFSRPQEYNREVKQVDDRRCWRTRPCRPPGRQIMTRIAFVTAASFSLLAVAACGTSTSDRAISGGAIGAGAGAVGGAVLGGSPLAGAAIGGAVGAAAGAVTDSNDIDLGRPIWR
jgi:osmotically inducible lipoprotein OsmB